MAQTENMIERLAVLDFKIEKLQSQMASIEPAQRRPPQWQDTLNRLTDARQVYANRMTQLDAFRSLEALNRGSQRCSAVKDDSRDC